MSQEFLNFIEYTPTLDNEECCYLSDPPLPITEPPQIVKALAFFMFAIFCQHIFKVIYGEEYNVWSYLENKFKDSLDFYFYNESDNDIIEDEHQEDEPQVEPKKYEDKYLEEFNKLPDNIQFTELEFETEKEQRIIIKADLESKLNNQRSETSNQISQLESQLKEIEDHMLNDADNASRKTDMIFMHNQEINRLKTVMEELQTKNVEDEEVNKLAKEFVVNERLNTLKNSMMIEKTPLGNVLMFYNNSRSSFEYYSDSTIPYRYLEVIGRKYVINCKCKQIYVVMSKEIEEAEKKLAEKKKKEEEKEKEQEEKMKTQPTQQQAKNVFAKFKKYNKDTSIKSAAVPLDRPAPAKQTTPQEDKIVKERANRYSFEGKLANFSFLKKVDRKVVDKRYAVSFSEFKRMQKK